MAKNPDKLGISTQYEAPVLLLKKWVDLHYEDEDETYNYSVQGGSVILFADLSAALNIGIDSAEVADVAFSDESLMKPVHVEEDTTVRALIEPLGLDIEYTADLTKEAISAMNARFVRAGDWVLISLHPFDTEEMLTLTTSDGKRYEIAVTDARIQKDFLTAGGETFTITITYGDDAHIPDDSDLNVTEILQGTEEFEKYLNQSAEKLGVESSEVSFARFFDAEITKDGVKVEPDAPVQVEIAYKEAIEIGTGETLSVVHFGENTEVINDLTLSDGDTCITYAQDSFSVTGTIISGTPENGEKQYMVITKIDNRYYIVNNNGTLTEVGYDESSGTVVVTNPMLWTFDNSNNGNRHIYFNSQATGFGDNQVASDFFRRYLVPNETTGACLEETRDDPADAGYLTVTVAKDGEWINREDHNKVVETNHVSNRNNALNATALNIATNGATSTISHNGQYLTVVRDGAGNPVSLGTGTSGEAAQFMFTTASKVPSGLHLDNAVNHIDISINGTASVKVPLAYGTYRIGSANGDEWVVEDNVYLELNEDDIPDSVVIDGVTMSREDQLKITAEDMKRATIAAFDKNGEELNDAFYITGYSQNATTSTSSEQIRIEGRFLAADLRGTQYEHVNGTRYDGNWWTWTPPDNNYVNAVRAARLQNIVDYKVTVVKPITFNLRDKNNNQLYDLEGEPLQVTVDVAFSGTFNYWDYGETDKNSGNECPPLQGNQDWRRGDIPNHDMSGMDFVLNGDANDPNSPLVAVEITKVIVDENGNILKVDKPVTSTVSLYRSATADRNGVKDYQIGDESNPKRDDDTGIYDESYTFVRDHKIVVDEGTGSRLIYDYHVSDGMYYIVERTDEDSGFAETITSGGEEWKYVKTYIDTEYVKRDYSYDELNDRNPMHRSGDYTLGDEYKSSPEVVGWFNTVTGERKKSAFLEYYVYNVYTKGKTLNVEKRWKLPEGEEAPAGAEVEVELYYATRANSSEAWPERTQENYTKLVPGTAPFEDYTAESLKTALALNQDNNWKGLFDGLPDKVTVDGTPCEVDYCAFETAVKLPGPGKTQVDETAIDVTKGYSVAYSDEDGREIITNTREVVELGAKKKWAEGTEIPEGAEVTVELRFATRLIVNAEGEAVEPLEDWPEDPEAEGAYLPVKDSTGYARVFQDDPRFDETTLVTERILTVDSEHLDSSWTDVFENLPKYLLTEEGILEVDYYAFETKVMVPDGQTQKDVMGDYAVTTVKEGVEDEGSNGMVTITNENNVTSLEVEKIWAKGTNEPDGAEVTVELRFAARMIRNADGTAIVPLPDWPMSEGSVDYESYQPVVKTDGVFDDLFKNARSFDTDNSTLVTELTLKADAEHPEYSWYGIFEDLPKYLRDADGYTWELDYYAVETAVNVPGEGEDGETMVNRLDDYQHVGVKTDAEGEAANTSDWYMAEGKPAMPQTEATIDFSPSDGYYTESITGPDENGKVTIVNKHEEEEPDTGILKLKKLVAINGKEFKNGDTRVDGEYTFTISGKSGTDTASVAEKVVKIQVTGGQPVSATLDGTTVELDENQFVTVSGLPYGDYVITENITALGNDIELYRIDGGQEDGDCAAGTITVTVSEIHSTSAEAVFVNNYTENYEVVIVKVEKGTEVPLDGAVFTLTQVGEDGRYLMVDGSNENYVKREVKTTSDGTLAFTGLISGIYEIEETMPPEHYVLDSNIVFYVKIDAGVVNWVAKGETGWIVKTGKDSAVSFTEAHAAIEADPENEIEAKDATNAVFTVENTPGMSLPSTGGPGTNLLYLIGIMLITLASMALIMKQKGNH